MSQTRASAKPERPASPNVTKSSGHRARRIVNWILALLTVPAALFVMAVGFGAAMGTDRCAYEDCARQGPPYVVMTLLFYGAPLVAALTIVASFRTAKRSWGILIPLAAFMLFGIDVVVLYLTF
jgi:hypothetical protein